MRKAPFKKPSDDKKQRRMTLRPTQSESNLSDPPPRKASTPKHDRTAATTSPDVSCISLLTHDTKIGVCKDDHLEKKNDASSKVSTKSCASGTPSRADIQNLLDQEYTRYIQSVFKNKLMETRASSIDSELASLQKRIETNQEILQKTSQRLKNINFNKEVDMLHSLNNPNYGKILESVDGSNCEEYLVALNEKLEQKSNQLEVKNIELPEGGAAQLMKIISETAEALERVKCANDNEAWKVLKEAVETNKAISNGISRSKKSIPEVERLLLTRSTMKICNQSDTDTCDN